eukprot:2170665-Rhodomonas_salina.3
MLLQAPELLAVSKPKDDGKPWAFLHTAKSKTIMFAQPDTDIACTRTMVRRDARDPSVLRARYAMSGTELRYAANRFSGFSATLRRESLVCTAISLRAPYAMSGTDIADYVRSRAPD